MSTSELYHNWGLRDYCHVSTSYVDGATIFHVVQKSDALRCSNCGSAHVTKAGQVGRTFRMPPVGSRPIFVTLPVQRLCCQNCGVTRQARLRLADPKRTYTHQFERYVLDLASMATIQAVAKHLGISWDVVKEILKSSLQRRFAKPKLKHLTHLAIDELCIGKGHRYITLVMDLQSGAIVFVGKGKGEKSLDPFWKRLRSSRAKIQAVATDMSAAYSRAVAKHLPKAAHVFDRFHVMKLLNEKISCLRQEMQREAAGPLARKTIKGIRWLILTNAEDLDDKKNEPRRLKEALDLNRPLAIAYYLKEDLRLFWQQKDKASADAFLRGWIARAQSSGVRILHVFAQTLALHRTGLLAYYDAPISTAALEGTNNKIRTMQSHAYGYRDQEFFELKLHALHLSTYALVG